MMDTPTFEHMILELKERPTPTPDLKDLISVIHSVLVKDVEEAMTFNNLNDFLKIRLEQSLGVAQSERISKRFTPIYVKALARAKVSEHSNRVDADLVYVLLRALFVYAIMVDSFIKLCGDTNQIYQETARIGRQEFLSRYEVIQGYGLAGCDNIRNPKEAYAVFDIISMDDGATIGLEDWIKYLSKVEISLKTEIGLFLQQENVVSQQVTPTAKQSKVVTIDSLLLNNRIRLKESLETASTKSDRLSQLQSGSSVSPQIQVNFTIGLSSSHELKSFTSALEAYTAKTLPGQKLRLQGFKFADQSGTGRCTLKDLETFIRHALGAKFSSGQSDKLYRIYQPSFSRAFLTTKFMAISSNVDSISITSFRLFIVCLLIYAAMYDSFRLAVREGGDREEIDKIHLDKSTFIRRFEKIKGSGFVGIDNIVDEEAANSIFDIMKSTIDDSVSFIEWVDYVEKAEIRMNTDIGRFLSQKQSSIPGDMSVVVSVATKVTPQKLTKTSDVKPLEIPSLFTVGIAATPNLRDFVETFKAYTDKSIEGQRLRVKEFKEVNSDGSGRCSLADLETFIKRILTTRFESSRTYYLFDLFRPSFARAYVKAQAFNYSKDYVSITEFRVFSVFTCVYASMYDAYSKILIESDWIKAEDFEARFGRLSGYDFSALARICDKDQAKDLFIAMDRSARGYIDFDDFCYCLEKVEISNKTKLGEFFGLQLVSISQK